MIICRMKLTTTIIATIASNNLIIPPWRSTRKTTKTATRTTQTIKTNCTTERNQSVVSNHITYNGNYCRKHCCQRCCHRRHRKRRKTILNKHRLHYQQQYQQRQHCQQQKQQYHHNHRYNHHHHNYHHNYHSVCYHHPMLLLQGVMAFWLIMAICLEYANNSRVYATNFNSKNILQTTTRTTTSPSSSSSSSSSSSATTNSNNFNVNNNNNNNNNSSSNNNNNSNDSNENHMYSNSNNSSNNNNSKKNYLNIRTLALMTANAINNSGSASKSGSGKKNFSISGSGSVKRNSLITTTALTSHSPSTSRDTAAGAESVLDSHMKESIIVNSVPSLALTAAAAEETASEITGNSGFSGFSGSSSSSYATSSLSLSSSSSSSSSSSLYNSNSRNNRQNNYNSNNNNNNNINNVNNNDSNQQNDQLPAQLSSRIIHTRNGALSGIIVQLDGRHLDPVEAYRGIPYASPPIGNLRFMPPVSAAMWSGVKKADRFSPVCPQRLPDIRNQTAALERMPKGRLEYLKRLLPHLLNQSEDCLYLNIYVPIQVASRDAVIVSSSSSGSGTVSFSSSSTSGGGSSSANHNQLRLPVMVFVHGESYEWNSGNPYDGSVLASFGQILVVTINYRLGILGFLNANTDRYSKLPANYGLMDIIAALHWLKENIAAFGGDPQSITLAGHGTGAACVHFLISSMAVPEGLLFNRAILMSGSGLTPWSLVSNPAKYAAIVAHHVKCAPDLTHAHFMKCLRDKSLDQLLNVPISQPEFGFAFGPSIDGVVIDGGDYIPPSVNLHNNRMSSHNTNNAGNGGWGTPGQLENKVLMRKSAINKLSRYDLMAGVTRAEAFFSFNSDDVQYGIEADRRSKILKSYVRNAYTYHLNEIFATIVNEYTDWERPVQHPINIRDETLEALSDAQVVAPAVQTVDLHSADHRNSYLYVFDYQTRYGDYPQRQGCIHGEDLPYIFGAPLVGGFNHFNRNYTKTEISLSEIVMLYWSNFVRTGNPNEQLENDHGSRQERSRYKTIEWTAYESVHKKYLNFDAKPKLKNHYRAHRLSFWLNLIPDLHKPGGDNVSPSHHQLPDDTEDMDNNIIGDTNIKPLNPPYVPGASNAALGNFSIFTNQVFSLLNLSSPSSSLQRNGSRYAAGKIFPDDMIHEGEYTGASSSPNENDGFAAYSTALSVTIAIGCSLLILNVLIFAGVYYQRDKTRLSEPRSHIKLKRQENGQMPNNICGDLETLTMHAKSDPATILSHHHALQHHQLPPPEFADIPHRVPPPPKHLKTLQDTTGVTQSGSGSGSGSGSLLPPPHALQIMGNQCGTLTKKSCMKQTSQQLQQRQQHLVTHTQHMQNLHNQQTLTTTLTSAPQLMSPPTVTITSATPTTHQPQQQHQTQHNTQQQQTSHQNHQHPLMDELRV